MSETPAGPAPSSPAPSSPAPSSEPPPAPRQRLIEAGGIGLFIAVLIVGLWRPWAPSLRDDTGCAQLGPRAVTSPSGLRYEDLVEGAGPSPKEGQTVVVHYRGRLTNGTEFDASRKRGEPFKFRLGKGDVIKGWDEGVATMKAGGVRRLVVPPDLGYGASAAPGGHIPPNSTLVFEVELLGFE